MPMIDDDDRSICDGCAGHNTIEHTRSYECTEGSDGCCIDCGASMTTTCAECGGTSYHEPGCQEPER